MRQKWKTIRLFISSTFRDMHAERDHLVRFVFPELKEKCRKHRVNLIDVDLRWGVSEQDAQDGKALDICLDEIDSCRPYFLGLLGHRYGWMPPGHKRSITAQEIYHGVLRNDVPVQVVDLRQIIEGRLEGKVPTEEQIDCLTRSYQWDAGKGKYLLIEETSSEDLEIIRSVFKNFSSYQRDRSFFFFRSESLTRELAGENAEDFFESEAVDQAKLSALKQEIIETGLSHFEYNDIEGFGHRVRDVLWERIEAELGETVEEEKDWFEEEALLQELFMADRTRRFVGRRDLLDRMHRFCEVEDESSLMVITGESGSGKSALMARFSEEAIHKHPDWLILPHFVGASSISANLRQALKRLCTLLNAITDLLEEVPEEIKELIKVFPDLLAGASQERKILIVLDAVNQMEKGDNSQAMRWLPQGLPKNVKCVISTLTGEALDSLRARRVKPAVETVYGLDEVEIRELVSDYLKEIRHEFPNRAVEQTFFKKVVSGNPLYILVALEELKVFGNFEELAVRVDRLPDDVPTLFDQVLERIESDFNPALVRDCMRLIACGRHGMTGEELQVLLRHHAPLQSLRCRQD